MATKALNYTAAEINQRLNLAGTAVQPGALNGYYTKTEVDSMVVVDLSVRYSASYANLSAALTALNSDTATDATAIKKGGVSIKFINSASGKYEQWNLKASSWSTDTSDWALDVDGSVANGKLKLPFELEKPSANEYVTQASEIGYNGEPLADEIDKISMLRLHNGETIFISLPDGYYSQPLPQRYWEVGEKYSYTPVFSGSGQMIVSLYDANDTLLTSYTRGISGNPIDVTIVTGTDHITLTKSPTANDFVLSIKQYVATNEELDTRLKAVEDDYVTSAELATKADQTDLEALQNAVSDILPVETTTTHNSTEFDQQKYVDINGEVKTSATWRSTDYIACKGVTSIIANCFLHQAAGSKGISFFDKDKVFISGLNLYDGDATIRNTLVTFGEEGDYPIPEGTEYVICGSHPNVVSGAYITITTVSENVIKELKAALNGEQTYTEYDSSYFTEQVYIDGAGNIGSSQNWKQTDYLPCDHAVHIVANCWLNHSTSKGISFFDANKVFITAYPVTAGEHTTANTIIKFGEGETLPIPSNAAYVRCGSHPNIVSSAYINITQRENGIYDDINKINQDIEELQEQIDAGGSEQERLHQINDGDKCLKLLFLGNSFAVQSSEYFIKICENLGYRVILGISYVGGATLQGYDQYYGKSESSTNKSAYHKYKYGRWIYNEGNAKNINIYSKLTDEDWDIVFLQQGSGSADTYSTYQPYANNLVTWIKANCPYADVKLGCLMPWAWSDARLANNSTAGGSQTNVEMYNGIVSAYSSFTQDINFTVIAKNGSAIQNLYSDGYAQTDIFGAGGDGQHLGTTIAKLTAGLCLLDAVASVYYAQDYDLSNINYTDNDVDATMFADAVEAVNSIT